MNNTQLSKSIKNFLKEIESDAQTNSAQEYINKLMDLASKGQFGSTDDIDNLSFNLKKAYTKYKRELDPNRAAKISAATAKGAATRKDNELMNLATKQAADQLGLSPKEQLAINLGRDTGPKGDKWISLANKIFKQLKK